MAAETSPDRVEAVMAHPYLMMTKCLLHRPDLGCHMKPNLSCPFILPISVSLEVDAIESCRQSHSYPTL
jgi:hypothetical protein